VEDGRVDDENCVGKNRDVENAKARGVEQ